MASGRLGIVRWMDKVVFLGFVGWCSTSALGAVATPPELVRARAQEPILLEIGEHMQRGRPHVAEPTAPRWCETLREQLDPTCVPPARAFPSWVMERRPVLLVHHDPGPPAPELAHRAGGVVGVETVARYSVRLTLEPAAGERVLVEQVLERRAGDGPWTRVKEVGPGEVEVHDVGLAPRTRYAWRIVSTGELDREEPLVAAALRRGKMPLELPAALARVEGPTSDAYETPPDVHIVVRAITLDPRNPADATADLIVHRWNPVTERFDARSLPIVKLGAPIGEGAHATGATLLEVGTRERTNPKFGWPQRVQWIKVREADGAEREVIDLDLPEELRRK